MSCHACHIKKTGTGKVCVLFPFCWLATPQKTPKKTKILKGAHTSHQGRCAEQGTITAVIADSREDARKGAFASEGGREGFVSMCPVKDYTYYIPGCNFVWAIQLPCFTKFAFSWSHTSHHWHTLHWVFSKSWVLLIPLSKWYVLEMEMSCPTPTGLVHPNRTLSCPWLFSCVPISAFLLWSCATARHAMPPSLPANQGINRQTLLLTTEPSSQLCFAFLNHSFPTPAKLQGSSG